MRTLNMSAPPASYDLLYIPNAFYADRVVERRRIEGARACREEARKTRTDFLFWPFLAYF